MLTKNQYATIMYLTGLTAMHLTMLDIKKGGSKGHLNYLHD